MRTQAIPTCSAQGAGTGGRGACRGGGAQKRDTPLWVCAAGSGRGQRRGDLREEGEGASRGRRGPRPRSAWAARTNAGRAEVFPENRGREEGPAEAGRPLIKEQGLCPQGAGTGGQGGCGSVCRSVQRTGRLCPVPVVGGTRRLSRKAGCKGREAGGEERGPGVTGEALRSEGPPGPGRCREGGGWGPGRGAPSDWVQERRSENDALGAGWTGGGGWAQDEQDAPLGKVAQGMANSVGTVPLLGNSSPAEGQPTTGRT